MNDKTAKRASSTLRLIGGPLDGDNKMVPLMNIKAGNILYFPFNDYITTYVIQIQNKRFVAVYDGGYRK